MGLVQLIGVELSIGLAVMGVHPRVVLIVLCGSCKLRNVECDIVSICNP